MDIKKNNRITTKKFMHNNLNVFYKTLFISLGLMLLTLAPFKKNHAQSNSLTIANVTLPSFAENRRKHIELNSFYGYL